MIGKVGLSDDMEAWYGAHEVVIDPEPAHGVMHGGIDTHRRLERVLVGDALIHLEEIAVALPNGLRAQSIDRLREVEIDPEPAGTDAEPLVARFLGGPRGDVPRRKIAEA